MLHNISLLYRCVCLPHVTGARDKMYQPGPRNLLCCGSVKDYQTEARMDRTEPGTPWLTMWESFFTDLCFKLIGNLLKDKFGPFFRYETYLTLFCFAVHCAFEWICGSHKNVWFDIKKFDNFFLKTLRATRSTIQRGLQWYRSPLRWSINVYVFINVNHKLNHILLCIKIWNFQRFIELFDDILLSCLVEKIHPMVKPKILLSMLIKHIHVDYILLFRIGNILSDLQLHKYFSCKTMTYRQGQDGYTHLIYQTVKAFKKIKMNPNVKTWD